MAAVSSVALMRLTFNYDISDLTQTEICHIENKIVLTTLVILEADFFVITLREKVCIASSFATLSSQFRSIPHIIMTVRPHSIIPHSSCHQIAVLIPKYYHHSIIA